MSKWDVAVEMLGVIAEQCADDPEVAHREADMALLEAVPDKVRAAYERVKDACDWWATS